MNQAIIGTIIALLCTILLGVFFFVVAPPLSDALQDLLELPIRDIALVGVCLIYFVWAQTLWPGILINWEKERRRNSVVKIIFNAIWLPAYMVGATIYEWVYMALDKIVFSHLHTHLRPIIRRAYATMLLIWISVFAVLLFANLWKEPASGCAWRFPKVLACVLTKYENLAGGVIGAGGTIFAGWLAWLWVQHQIELSGTSSGGARKEREDDYSEVESGNSNLTVAGAELTQHSLRLRLFAAFGGLVALYIVFQLVIALTFSRILPRTQSFPEDISIEACLPLKEARLLTLKGDDISESVPLENMNETVIVIANDTAKNVGPISIQLSAVAHGRARPEQLYSRVLATDKQVQNISASPNAAGMGIRASRLEPKGKIAIVSAFPHPVSYMLEMAYSGSQKRELYVRPGCTSSDSLKVEGLATHFQYVSSRCTEKDAALQCDLNSEPLKPLGADERHQTVIIKD